ncbi:MULTISPECIES: Lrp/AsnC family transcriptional regulator [unclassified Streptomyces]|uniref:Lrp/AsnC family transcriptional regulator n=1 Tax=unclassified Streptomyces TaxID=2593676 RepID=UPI000F71C3C1|nr:MULTISPECIES: Lrp/AsnC family transcriptional regulator [unclassified Streptomyces]AZM64309.1 ArsR family transcriptional regulator [Streptomyces sp. WAC 01438]RSM98982.1 ArsR family transcriptional regulator [Streptomyces sp. WAC 01420]
MSNEEPLDSIDREILFHLRRDGRMSNVELAARVGLTPPPCLRRLKRLEERGVITGYRAVVDAAALGRGMEVIVSVEVSVTDVDSLRHFETTVAALDEVIEVRRVFGVPDYFLRVAVADADAYAVFQMTKLVTIPGVSRVISYLTMEVIKSES